MSGHPSCRRLTKTEILEVETLSTSGVQPRNILSSLRLKNPNIQAVARTVYNAKIKIRNEKLDGKSMIEALFEEFGRAKFLYNYKCDEDNHLTHLFLAHPKSVMLSKIYRKVYVLDCTYKTNMYKMPLLDVIGISSSNKFFYSCFVFLKKEKDEDYVWALEMFKEMIGPTFQPLVIVSDRDMALKKAILVVFPQSIHLLCIWHIQKNIVAKCKSHFIKDEDWEMFLSTWSAVMYAVSEKSFGEAWVLLELLYKEKAAIITYIKETWMPYKEMFVTAWTDKHPHFGNRVSSRAEGAHAKLKSYLQVSTGDLAQVVSKISLAVENEFHEICSTLQSERIRVPHRCRVPLFKFLLNHISHFALSHLFKQYEMVKFGTLKPECTGHFTATMGLPCAHMMSTLKESSLLLNFIDSQWILDTTMLPCVDAGGNHSDNDGITRLCGKLLDRYQEAPIVEKKEIEERLAILLDASKPLPLEPNVQLPKGRPPGSLNRRKEATKSTKRAPSEFEIVEASLNRKNKEKIARSSESQNHFGVSDSEFEINLNMDNSL
ncbi:protein FAR1-RELATED SEQUENCE 5-like [Silene latifolia]|uniref:protein FAR1-RELATED SEQUENCE 5-like n=1 Tax=Silene latifolia TaxID=37657 RepID=UPI003D770798